MKMGYLMVHKILLVVSKDYLMKMDYLMVHKILLGSVILKDSQTAWVI